MRSTTPAWLVYTDGSMNGDLRLGSYFKKGHQTSIIYVALQNDALLQRPKTNEERPHHIIFRGTVATTIRHIKAFPPGDSVSPYQTYSKCAILAKSTLFRQSTERIGYSERHPPNAVKIQEHTQTHKKQRVAYTFLESLRLSAHSIRKSWCNNHLGDSIASSALEAWDDRPEHLTR